MTNSLYTINKGINKSPQFKGLRGQYIWWLACGLVFHLILFALLYLSGINNYLSVGAILALATCYIRWVYRLNNVYGEHGLMKKLARQKVPLVIKCYSRKMFVLCREN